MAIERQYEGFKEYVALLTQTSTNAPTVTVLRNTLSGTVSWAYTSTGNYTGTLTGEFTGGKTVSFCNLSSDQDATHEMTAYRFGDNSIRVITYSSGAAANGLLTNTPIIIRVYPASNTKSVAYQGAMMYTASLTQTGTSAPTATVIRNSLGGTLTWSRDAQGTYSANFPFTFDLSKALFRYRSIGKDVYNDTIRLEATTTTLTIYSDRRGVGLVDEVLNGSTIEIAYYPQTATFIRPYRGVKVYRALMTQTGTNAPTATIIENTLGGTISWAYTSTGSYTGTLTGAFTANKTLHFVESHIVYNDQTLRYAGSDDEDTVYIKTVDDGVQANDKLSSTLFEIYVYE